MTATVAWDGDTYKYTDLDKYDAEGYEYTYSVTEASITGYATTQDGNNFVNTLLTEATIKKVWEDGDNKYDTRPAELKVKLSNGQEVTLNEANNWTETVTDLPAYDTEGNKITYSWTEGQVEGYRMTKSVTVGSTVTTLINTLLTKATVKKVWDDDDNRDGIRPESLTLTLNGTTGVSVTLNDDNDWTATVVDLPQFVDGVEVEYSWTEGEIEDYELTKTEKEGTVITITNTHEVEMTTIKVVKKWKDNSDAGKQRSKVEAYFCLSKTVDGVSTEVETVAVGTENDWSIVWDVPVYENGKPITYSVKEVLVKANGYTCNTTDWKTVENGTSITITNTLKDNTPGTGDNTRIMLWSCLMLVSAIGCGALWIASRKKEEAER